MHVALACLLLFASGAAALVLEALWLHQAAIALGSDAIAASCVLAAFMGGLALGGVVAARLVRGQRHALYIYAALELCVGGLGLLAVHALPLASAFLVPLTAHLPSASPAMLALRIGCTLALLGIPATAMGATLPVMLAAVAPGSARFGRALGALYAANTLGAVSGVMMAELHFVPHYGVRGSALFACAACAGLAIVAALAARRIAQPAQPAQAPELSREERMQALSQAAPLLLAAGLCGFVLLALETVWLRFLALALNDTPLAFAVVLATVLGGIALGSALAARFAASAGAGAGSALAFAGGALVIAGYHAYSALLQTSFRIDQDASTVLAVSAPLVLPASLASGALYAVLGARIRQLLARSDRGEDARAAGWLSFSNTTGAALGALAGGLLLLPRAGMERALIGLAASYGAIGLLLALAASPHGPASKTALGYARRFGPAALLLVLLASFPFGDVRARFITAAVERWMQAEDRIVSISEGRSATLVHVEHRQHGLPVFDQIATNAYSMTVNDYVARRYMKLYAYLPMATHPRIERALVIGYGLGSTAQAVLDNPDVKRLDIVDTEPKLLEMASSVRAASSNARHGSDPLQDPRTRVHIDDGRHFVQGVPARGGHYDLITGEPPPPIVAGVVHLYTREYFEQLASALRAGGMVTYWLPMMNLSATSARAIIAGFCSAMPDCSLWHGAAKNFMLLGIKAAPAVQAPLKPEEPSLSRFTRPFRIGALRNELISIGIEAAPQLGTLFIGDSAYLAKLTGQSRKKGAWRRVEPLTDDFPRRIVIRADRNVRDALIWGWRDTAAALKRFKASELIARLFPPNVIRDAGRQFDTQRLINDLLLSVQTGARQTAVLGQVLERTALHWPPLLMLGSDPDIQAALEALPPNAQLAPELVRHRLASLLVSRDFKGAQRLMARMPQPDLLPGLSQYVKNAALRE